MPALRTEITEIVTGLGMFGYPNLSHALGMRPPAFENVNADVYDRLAEAYRANLHHDLFSIAWTNGVRFAAAPEGLRGRPPWIVEWKGAHRPPGYEDIPADLRVDHVYLVSCKYGSNILTNSSPSNLFGEVAESDWFLAVAPDEYQELFQECRTLVPDPQLPDHVRSLQREQRLLLKRTLPRSLAGSSAVAYRRFAVAAGKGSSQRWQKSLATKLQREQMVWRLLRLRSAPYFVLGESADGRPIAYRVQTPWDLRASHDFRSFRHWGDAERGQPVVGWSAVYRDRVTGGESTIEGHVEVRWSHGKFAQAPEAKVYLDTPHHAVPAYVPLAPSGGELALF